MTKQLLTLIAAAALALPVAAQTAADTAIQVSDYTVFVDPPTGFAFVKLPTGWKFVGKVEQEALANLPSGVVTSLLKREAESIDVAGQAPAQAARAPGNG